MYRGGLTLLHYSRQGAPGALGTELENLPDSGVNTIHASSSKLISSASTSIPPIATWSAFSSNEQKLLWHNPSWNIGIWPCRECTDLSGSWTNASSWSILYRPRSGGWDFYILLTMLAILLPTLNLLRFDWHRSVSSLRCFVNVSLPLWPWCFCVCPFGRHQSAVPGVEV